MLSLGLIGAGAVDALDENKERALKAQQQSFENTLKKRAADIADAREQREEADADALTGLRKQQLQDLTAKHWADAADQWFANNPDKPFPDDIKKGLQDTGQSGRIRTSGGTTLPSTQMVGTALPIASAPAAPDVTGAAPSGIALPIAPAASAAAPLQGENTPPQLAMPIVSKIPAQADASVPTTELPTGNAQQQAHAQVIANNNKLADLIVASNPDDSRMKVVAETVRQSPTPLDPTKFLEFTKPKDAKTPTHVAGTVDGKPVFGIEQPDGSFTVNGQPAPNFRPPQTAGERIIITNEAKKGAYAPNADGTPNAMAKALAEYKLPMTGRQLTSENSRPLVEAALAINPDFDAKMYDVRKQTKEKYTTGAQGQQIVAFNTAIHHIDQLQDAAKALGNGDFTPANEGYQALQQMFGAAAPNNMAALRELVAVEVAKANGGGVPQKDEIAAQREVLATKNSPAQIAGYVKTIIPALGAKIKSLDTQYRQVMGKDDPYQPVFPETQPILDKYNSTTPSLKGQTKTTPHGTFVNDGTGWVKQ